MTHGKLRWHELLVQARAATPDLAGGRLRRSHNTFSGIYTASGAYATSKVSDGMEVLKKFASRR